MRDFSSQRGNVLFIILLAIALFAALSYAALQGSRSGTAGMTDEQAKIVAQEILSYANNVSDAVQRMRLRGVTETQFSFENTVFQNTSGTNYHPIGGNANCTTESCKVFALGGGAITAKKVGPQGVVESAGAQAGAWIAYTAAMTGIGSTAGDLIFAMAKPSLQVCKHLNKMIGISATLDEAPALFTPPATVFNGTYSNTAFGAPAALDNKTEYCYELGSSPGSYVYVRAVLAR